MRRRWIAIAMTAAGLALAPVMVGAQMAPGGSMGPGTRSGRGPMPGEMGMGAMQQMQGMMRQMQGMTQRMADMLKTGAMSPEQMKRMGALMEQMVGEMGETHAMMGGARRDPRAMHEPMARMQQRMAEMQKHMAELMGSAPSTPPPAGERHSGTVVSVKPESLLLAEIVAGGKERKLLVQLTAQTRVVVSDRNPHATGVENSFTNTPINAADIKPGDFVVVGLSRGKKAVAESITVTLRARS